jgi:transposase-like protein
MNLKEFINAYHKLSHSDRVVFYSTVTNNVDINADNLQDFLTKNRITEECKCVYCSGKHIVKNGTRKDGVQTYICRDCGKSFSASSNSITSRTRKKISIWAKYLKCMIDKKTLNESADECGISLRTAFVWRHKILDAIKEVAEKTYLEGVVEADETFFNVSYKGNHSKSNTFTMPRKAHKRGGSVHTKGLSNEKVCVPCAIDENGISYAKPAKLGKVSSYSILYTFDNVIAPSSTLCTDHEKAYLDFAKKKQINLIQMEVECNTLDVNNRMFGIQRINAYHSRLQGFIKKFHGVATKYLDNYIVWNDIVQNNHRNTLELLKQLLWVITCIRKTIYNRDIPRRAALPEMS